MTLGKIIKIVAIRCQILRLKCTKFNFGWGSAPDPAGGAYSVLPDPLAGLRGLLLRGGEGTGLEREGEPSASVSSDLKALYKSVIIIIREGRRRDPTP